jgi:ribosomal protein L37AE/L43A
MNIFEIIYPTLVMCGPIALVLILGIVITALWLKIMDKNIRACPKCGRKAAGFIVETTTERLGSRMDYKRRNPVRITTEKVTDHYQCEFCGHRWEKSFNRTGEAGRP